MKPAKARVKRFEGCFDGYLNNLLRGWAFDIENINSQVTVAAFVNGRLYSECRSDLFRDDLLRAGKGKNGCCAFEIPFDPFAVMADERVDALTVEIVITDGENLLLGRQQFPGGAHETFNVSHKPLHTLVSDKLISTFENLKRKGRSLGSRPAIPIATESSALNQRVVRSLEERLQATRGGRQSDLRYRVVGHFDDHYSLSVVNRGIALSLRDVADCSIYHVHGSPIDGPLNAVPTNEFARLEAMLTRWDCEDEDANKRISICHHYPPIEDPHPAHLRLAMFFWEESVVPTELIEHFNSKFDGLLVASRFVKKVLRDSGCALPIEITPLGVDHIIGAEGGSSVADGQRDDVPYRFLHVSSCFARKGIDALLQAYFEEFSGNDSVELYIKTFRNPHNDIHGRIDRLRASHANPPQVIVDEEFMNEAQLVALYRSCGAVVLPTRGEGFNLPAAEAMALGRPVIATGYSAQIDFLNEDTGWTIDYALSSAAGHLSAPDSFWAEPNVAHLRRLLRGFFAFDEGRGSFVDARMKLDARRFQQTINKGLLQIRKSYRWNRAAATIDVFARNLLERRERSERRPRIAWVSSWNVRCGIAEYSRHLVDRLNAQFEIVHICDRRTPPAENIYPLYDQDSSDSFLDVHEFLLAQSFDAVVIQHHPTFFDISGDAAARLADIQTFCPVFLFFHSTRFLRSLPDEDTHRIARMLAELEGLFVHTLEDVNLLKAVGLIQNVCLFPHGIEAPDDLDELMSNGADRNSIADEFARLDARKGSASAAKFLAQSLRKADFWIGTFGFLLPHKRNKELLAALRLVHDSGLTGVKLLFLCAALDQRSIEEANALIAAAEASGLANDVAIVTDFLPIEQSMRLLSAADLLAFAYQGTTESASGAARVALSTGRPVLTTPEPIFESLGPTVHRSAGWSVEAIATAIIALARDRVALGSTEDAQRTWIRLYSYSRLTTRLSNILKGSIADFRPRSVDVARGIALTRSSIDIVAPLCPPGIRYPEQGAMFGWREKLIALDADSTILRDELDEAKPTVFVRWNADRLWLEAPNEIGVSTPLHLHRDLRHCLDHSALILSEISRAALSTKQSAALLLYARRHGLRVALVMVPSNRASFDQSAFLADVLLFAGEAERKTWLRSAMQATSWRERSRVVSLLPQLHILGERALSYLHESATLRMVTIYSNGSSNPLLDALGRRAAQINASAGRDVLRFDREASIPAEDDSDWAIAVIGAPEAQRNCPVFEANRGRRRWIGVVAQETSEELRNREAVLSFIAATERFELLIFTSAPDYRRTLAKICAHGDIIALLRRKCVLLESAVARNDEELVERFARVLRLRKPTPSTALWKAFPKLSARPFERSRKKLSVCVSTYNRAHWLRVTIPLWAADIARYRRQVEFVVVDNASTDDTELVMLDLSTRFDIVYHRNSKNVGMLGNLAVTAEHASGDYVWILGDDDLVKPGTVGNLLKVINRHPRTELIYLNYSYTHFDSPDDLKDVDELMRSATAIAEPTESKFHEKIVEFAAHNENFFTAIYACVFRRDHALGAFCQFTDDPPFSSMRSCIPTTKYVLENMLDRPGFWVGSTQLVVNMNVSWIRYAPIWHMERLVEVFDLAEERGVPPEKIMRYRRSNIGQVLHFLPKIFEENDVYVAEIVNMQRYIESAKRVDRFAGAADELLRKYETGRRKGRLFDTRSLSTTSLRVVYGIESVSDGRRVNFTNGHEFGFGRSLV